MRYLLEATVIACLLTFALGVVADTRPVIFERIDSRLAVVACGLVALVLAFIYGLGIVLGYGPT